MTNLIIIILVLLNIIALIALNKEKFMSFKSIRTGQCDCKGQIQPDEITASGTVYVENPEENTGLSWIL